MKNIILPLAMAALLFSFPAKAAPQDMFNVNSTTAPVITCTTTPSSVALGNSGAPNILVYNAGTAAVFIKTGGSAVSATFPTSSAVEGTVIGPGVVMSLSKEPTHTYIACDALSGTNTVYVSSSKGE